SRRATEVDKRLQHIRHHEHRRYETTERRQLALADDKQRRPVGDREACEIMPVDPVALDGEKGLAGRDRAAVDGYAGHALRQVAERAGMHGGDEVSAGPEPFHRSSSSNALRSSAWSENGSVTVPTVCPSSCPLPATISVSPGCSMPTALRIASARSAISVAPL